MVTADYICPIPDNFFDISAVEANEVFDFRGVRLDWFRLQVKITESFLFFLHCILFIYAGVDWEQVNKIYAPYCTGNLCNVLNCLQFYIFWRQFKKSDGVFIVLIRIVFNGKKNDIQIYI